MQRQMKAVALKSGQSPSISHDAVHFFVYGTAKSTYFAYFYNAAGFDKVIATISCVH